MSDEDSTVLIDVLIISFLFLGPLLTVLVFNRIRRNRWREEDRKWAAAAAERTKAQEDAARKAQAEERARSERQRKNHEEDARARAKEQARQRDSERERNEKSKPQGQRPGEPPWHEILGVDADATAEEVKRAWRRLIAQYHPDKVSGLAPEIQVIAQERSREINGAYDAFKNQQRNKS
jgi:hypothetical protein